MNLKIVLGSQAAQESSSAYAPFGDSSPFPVLSHSAQHLPGSSSAAHLPSLLKDVHYASLHYGDLFHSNTLHGQSSLEVPMWFQPVSDGPLHAWLETHRWTTGYPPIISSLLSSVSVCA